MKPVGRNVFDGPGKPARWLGSLLVAALIGAPSVASEVEILRVANREAALEGETDGVSVGPLGELRPAPVVEKLLGFDEPFVFSAASAERGWILGTGNDGKVFFTDRQGGTRVIARLPEPEVFAVHGSSSGVFAAGSPDGRVYRLSGGEAEPLFNPEATYVWALAQDSKGRILAATGLPGRLLRFDGERVETLYESPDAHVRSLLIATDGSIYLGTAGQGLVVRLDPQGRAETLYDASEPEVLAFADAGDRIYVALLASEASFVDLSPPSSEEGEAAESPTPTIGSRSGDHEGPRSVVLSVAADGTIEPVAQLVDETIHALAFYGTSGQEQLWVGTGQEGRLYRLSEDELILEAELEDRQVVALAEGPGAHSGRALGVVTANSAAVYRLDGSLHPQGVYSSKIHDLGQASDFGVFRWRGSLPSEARVEVAFRSGMSADPDATWSSWTPARTITPGQELPLGELSGRFLQWRLQLETGTDPGPRIQETELSYRQRNKAPEIKLFSAQDPGLILVPQSFNPTSTTFEPWSPNRDGIFTSVRKERESSQVKTLWKKGYRTLKWEATDANDDPLSYALEVRPDKEGAPWVSMVEGLEETWFSFDSTVLPDGVYRFRLTATDEASNQGQALRAREITEPTTIDHSGPEVVKVTRGKGRLTVEVRDARSPLRDAQWSVDAASWQNARPVDGLLDSRRERLVLEVPESSGWVILRLTDAAFNVVTLDLSNE